eukprot:scaffold29447_cov90-Isochrysis_galbana.AAC.2
MAPKADGTAGLLPGGRRRTPQSGKQKKTALRQRRERQRADGALEPAEAADASAAALAPGDGLVLRCRLAIARGRKHCQVRLVMRITAPRAPDPPRSRRRPNATERRLAARAAQVSAVQVQLGASNREGRTAEAVRVWLGGVRLLVELLNAEGGGAPDDAGNEFGAVHGATFGSAAPAGQANTTPTNTAHADPEPADSAAMHSAPTVNSHAPPCQPSTPSAPPLPPPPLLAPSPPSPALSGA